MASVERTRVLSLLLMALTCTGVCGSFCSGETEIAAGSTYEIATINYPGYANENLCGCTASPLDGVDVLLHQQSSFHYMPAVTVEEVTEEPACNPMLGLHYDRVRMYTCSVNTLGNGSVHAIHLSTGQQATWSLYNPALDQLQARIYITVVMGTVSLQCSSQMAGYEGAVCPCGSGTDVAVFPARDEEDFDQLYKTEKSKKCVFEMVYSQSVCVQLEGAMVATVCVVAFLGVIAIIGFIYWWRKRQAGEKYLNEPNPPIDGSENRAYAASRSNLELSSPPPVTADTGYAGYTPYLPESELDLSLQTPPNNNTHGSTDSGLYSMKEGRQPNDNGHVYNNGAPGGPPQEKPQPKQPQEPVIKETPLDAHALYSVPVKPNPASAAAPAPLPGSPHTPQNRMYKAPSQGSIDNLAFSAHNASKGSIHTIGSVETDV